ncbi:carboxypeptidase-like regulatory domain-containing protein [Acidicapsa ligni]|uniref:carboxypeptidase-like regulatory domain-containing protein n=1 Tax=Acidicapsa ligni TaxID=542300 RepID=UPI0021E06CFF|nr:carboxypeptidase-like regulatory domain-containing protein [Acidicapsa ligni]
MALFALCFCLLSLSARAQTISNITGTVTDASGAIVPGANITIENTATHVVSKTVTNAAGSYVVADMLPGAYVITIEREGFQKRVISNVHVDVSEQTRADAQLSAGSVTETVEVAAPAISLETTQPQLGTVIENKITEEIPVLIGGGPGNQGPRDRQIDDYLFLAPGVTGGEWSHRINGGTDYANTVMFNGVVAVQAETQGYQSNINPPFEMVNEVRILTNSFSAQYGLGQGVASYQFASGTDTLHGDGFEVLRNTMFNAAGANPGFNADGTKESAPSIHEHNFGFSVGGPVVLPKLYNGQKKTFFHVSSDWFRLDQKDTGTMTVPTVAEVNGDFSNLLSLATPQPIFVPQGFVAPQGCDAPAPGQQWQGNVIPKGCFSASSASLLSFIPAPSQPGLSNNASSSIGTLPTRQTNWGLSVDHNLTEVQKLHVSFWRDKYHYVFCCSNNAHFGNELGGATDEPRLGTGLFVTYSTVLSPRLIMSAGFGGMGEINNGFNAFMGVSLGSVADESVLPTISFNQNGLPNAPTTWGNSTAGSTIAVNRKLGLSFDNNWLWTMGRHTFNIGWELRRAAQDDNECPTCGGSFAFSNRTTSDPNDIGNTGNAFASFLLGDADSSYRRLTQENKLRNFYVGSYIQDDIKVTPKLTVNAGLRWDVMVPFHELSNNVVYFDANATNAAAVTPGGAPLLGAANKLGVSGYDRADIIFTHFDPRFGVAYGINRKTVISAGFSINHLNGGPYDFGNNKLSLQYGTLLAGIANVNSNGSNIPGNGQWDLHPLPIPGNTPFTPTEFNGLGVLHAFSKNPGSYPYGEYWNIGVQRELPYNLLLSVAYVGNRGVHLPSMVNPINQTDPKNIARFCPSGNVNDPNCVMSPNSPNYAWTSAVAQADLRQAGFAPCPGGTTSAGFYAPYCNFMKDYGANAGLAQALLPYPQYNPSESCGGLCNPFDMNGSSTYNGVQTQLLKRYADGLSILANYTYARSLSNTDSGFAYQNYGSLNKFNQKAEWTVAGADQTHMVNLALVYELPFGPGKTFFNTGGYLGKNLWGGWQVSGAFQYASGTPLTVYSNSSDPLLNGFNRANFNASTPLHVNYNNYYKGLPVYNTAAFSDPGFGPGNSPRNLEQLRTSFGSNENLALAKRFYGGERINMELRIEFFNVLNRMQVCSPDDTVTDGANNFGLVQPNGGGGSSPCQANTPRQGQAYFKVSF